MKLRTGTPWMPATEYARTLKGLSLNLIVKNIDRSLQFHRQVLGATVVYSDPDFAVVQAVGAEWMLHADHTYLDHEANGLLSADAQRGLGLELRLHGLDPDRAEAAARELGLEVLSPSADKPYGLREAQLRDPDGYIWVPDVQLPPED